jgi:hypothetical protein
VAALKRSAHSEHISDALEAVVYSSIRRSHNDVLNRLLVILGIDALCGTQLLGQIELAWVGVDGQNARGTHLGSSLHSSKTHTTQAKHGDGRTLRHLEGEKTESQESSEHEQTDDRKKMHRDRKEIRVREKKDLSENCGTSLLLVS